MSYYKDSAAIDNFTHFLESEKRIYVESQTLVDDLELWGMFSPRLYQDFIEWSKLKWSANTAARYKNDIKRMICDSYDDGFMNEALFDLIIGKINRIVIVRPAKKENRLTSSNIDCLLSFNFGNSEQGVRDKTLIHLLVDTPIYLRQLVKLKRKNFILGQTYENSTVEYRYRDEWRYERLSGRSFEAIKDLFDIIPSEPDTLVFWSSLRDKNLNNDSFTTNALFGRVRKFGKMCGIENLAPQELSKYQPLSFD